MADSVNLALPYLEAAQAQKHVTHNEALTLLDACVQLSVSARNIITPPADPQQGERFIIDAVATGIFSGRVNQIAYWDKAGWRFLAPHVGWLAWVANESALSYLMKAAGLRLKPSCRNYRICSGWGSGRRQTPATRLLRN